MKIKKYTTVFFYGITYRFNCFNLFLYIFSECIFACVGYV